MDDIPEAGWTIKPITWIICLLTGALIWTFACYGLYWFIRLIGG